MPPFSHLRSDYPLNLTLLEGPYARVLKQPYRAGLTSARATPVSLIGSNWWFLSRPLVDRAFDAQLYSGTLGRHFYSVEFQLHIDEQLTPQSNTGAHICAATLNSIPASWRLPWLSPNSALYAVVAVHMLSTSGRHFADNQSFLSGVSNAELDARSVLVSVTFWPACSQKAEQVRST